MIFFFLWREEKMRGREEVRDREISIKKEKTVIPIC